MRKHWFCLALAAVCVIAVSVSPLTTPATADEERDEVQKEEATEEPEGTEGKTYTLTLTSMADPEYPEDAKEANAGGEVVLELTVTPDGEVWSIEVIEGSEIFPSFDEAAVDAASQWTFTVEGDVDENVSVLVPVEFKMEGERTMRMTVTVPDASPADEGAEPAPKPPGSRRPEEDAEPEPPAAPEAPAAPVTSEDSAEPAPPAPPDPPDTD